MSDQSKTSKRLGIVGAAAVVGLVPISILGAAPAFAVSSASLTLSSQNVGAANVTATNSFTVGASVPGGTGTLTITSTSNSGGNTATTAVQLPTTVGSYTVSFTPQGGTATSDTIIAGGSTTTASAATLEVTTTIPANAVVTVTASGATNPTAASTVYFQDSTSSEPTPLNTNSVNIGSPTSATPTVTGVNPTAFTAALGEPFTIAGSGFNTSGLNPPVVCFVQSGTTIPAGGTATNPCTGTGTAAGTLNAGVGAQSATQLQGVSPALTGGKTYSVVVYNWNDASAVYTAGSATSGVTTVGAETGLNFVPESGIRAVDSRSGIGLPKGSLTPKTPYAIAASTFVTSVATPTNVPTTADGLSLNVTAVGPTGPGNLQVWEVAGTACGTAPTYSTVNFQNPQDTSNSTFLAFSNTGTVCVQDNGASVPVVMDVTGYTTGTGLTPATGRILDTRSGTGSLLGPLHSGTVYSFHSALAANTPVVLNVTAVAPSSVGNLRVFPEPASGPPAASAVPNTSVITYIPNTDASSLYVTTVGANGNIDLYSAGTGTVNVVFDEVGTLTGSSLTPVAQPFRIYDSRPGGIAAGGTATATASPSGSGAVFVPASALGVVGDIGDINPAAAGNLRTFPQGGAVPGTSTINNFPMQTRSTSAVVALNPSNGQFSIQSSGSATNATFDVTGYIPGNA